MPINTVEEYRELVRRSREAEQQIWQLYRTEAIESGPEYEPERDQVVAACKVLLGSLPELDQWLSTELGPDKVSGLSKEIETFLDFCEEMILHKEKIVDNHLYGEMRKSQQALLRKLYQVELAVARRLLGVE